MYNISFNYSAISSFTISFPSLICFIFFYIHLFYVLLWILLLLLLSSSISFHYKLFQSSLSSLSYYPYLIFHIWWIPFISLAIYYCNISFSSFHIFFHTLLLFMFHFLYTFICLMYASLMHLYFYWHFILFI